MVCCVTGHRPKSFPFRIAEDKDAEYFLYIDLLYNTVEKLIYEGYSHFITGMADGADIHFGQCVSYYKDDFEYIKLEAALPYPIRSAKNPTQYMDEREDLLLECDIKTEVSPCYFKGCMQKRNRYMVDKSDLVLAIWNGSHSGGTWNTIKYARSKNKEIRYIMLNELSFEE